MKGLVEEKGLFVTLTGESVNLGVVTLFLGEQLLFAFFKRALDDELVVEVLVRAADADGGVFEYELGVTLGGEGADEIQLTLRQLDEGFLGAGAEDQLSDWGMLAIRCGGEQRKTGCWLRGKKSRVIG